MSMRTFTHLSLDISVRMSVQMAIPTSVHLSMHTHVYAHVRKLWTRAAAPTGRLSPRQAKGARLTGHVYGRALDMASVMPSAMPTRVSEKNRSVAATIVGSAFVFHKQRAVWLRRQFEVLDWPASRGPRIRLAC